MNADLNIVAKVQKLLEERVSAILAVEGSLPRHDRHSPPAVEQKWNQCIEGIGARRVGKLTGVIVQPEKGVVRLKDPLGHIGSCGFVEMDEQTLEKVATLGMP